jgi:LmbE family N-acetylglucosaminyl deacetylase
VVAVSPHLDDAAFSVGATLATLSDAGHDVTVLTVFAGSVRSPTGFALACQTDKGLAAEVDYMAVRRAEDAVAVAVLRTRFDHLPFREAPHRGYECAAALFAGVRSDDVVWQDVRAALRPYDADLWLAPQGLGGHVDHLQVVRAVAALDRPTAWWRDAPYVLRAPGAAPSDDLPGGLEPVTVPGDEARRADACACYGTQLGFQFGGADGMRAALAGMSEPLLADAWARPLLAGSAAAQSGGRGRQ